MLITAGLLIVMAAGVGSIALRDKTKPRLADLAFVLMIAGVLVLNIGLWTTLDDTNNLAQWFAKILVAAATLVIIPVAIHALRTSRRRETAEQETRMNILTSYRDHTRLRRQLRSDYTDDTVQQYMAAADTHNQLRITLRTISAYALGLIAVIAAAYNVLRSFSGDGNHISIIELAFPFLALAYSWTLHRTNKGLDAKYTTETIEHVNNAKYLNELINRERR